MLKPGIFGVVALGLAVWILALVGALSVATTIASRDDAPQPTRPPPLLAAPEGDTAGADLAGLPRFENFQRTEYQHAVFGDERVTEVEYIGAETLTEVRNFYGSAFRRGGWTVTGSSTIRGGWTYLIASGQRKATVELERMGDLTEVEIELVEPAVSRDELTDR